MALANPLAAKQSDRSKPVDVTAHHADAALGQPNGVSHITGAVVITQGTLKATAANATVHFDADSQVKRVVLKGNAHIQQLDDNGNMMNGDAAGIDYNVPQGIAILTGDAHVKQEGRGSASGDKLVYNTQTSRMTAEGGGDGGRVHLTFKARQEPSASKPAATPSPTGSAPAPAGSVPAPAGSSPPPATSTGGH